MKKAWALCGVGLLLIGCGGSAPTGDGPARPAAAEGSSKGQGTQTAVPLAHEEVLVPAGEFIMGSDKGSPDELPVHLVTLDAFYIDKFEVTVRQYRACVEAGICEEPTIASLCNWDGGLPDTNPINCMTWEAAKAYCEWAGQRLPTEAEWEKAARGTDRRTYPWGEDLDRQHANYREGSGRSTDPVGSYEEGVSPYGAYDMAGNVWEWVADWYAEDYYSKSPRENPPGPERGEHRILRGGSWWFEAPYVRSARRQPYLPLVTDIDIGFRCARNL